MTSFHDEVGATTEVYAAYVNAPAVFSTVMSSNCRPGPAQGARGDRTRLA